jgi:hypothetical protein
LDVVTDDVVWADWSIAQLEAASLTGPLLINDTIYAELSIRYERIEHLDRLVSKARLEIAAMPRAALFLAGKAFVQCRRASGVKTGVLPDFFIGAHAAVSQFRC